MVDKKQASKYQYAITVILASIFIAVAGGLFVGKPLYENLRRNGEEIEEKNLTLKKLEDNLTVLKNLDSRREELIEKNEKTLAAIPTDKDIARLFIQFERVANESSVYIKSVREKKTPSTNRSSKKDKDDNKGEIVEVYHEVAAESSSYGNIKKAFKNFEESLRILSITEVSIRKEGTNPLLKITLLVKTYKRI